MALGRAVATAQKAFLLVPFSEQRRWDRQAMAQALAPHAPRSRLQLPQAPIPSSRAFPLGPLPGGTTLSCLPEVRCWAGLAHSTGLGSVPLSQRAILHLGVH